MLRFSFIFIKENLKVLLKHIKFLVISSITSFCYLLFGGYLIHCEGFTCYIINAETWLASRIVICILVHRGLICFWFFFQLGSESLNERPGFFLQFRWAFFKSYKFCCKIRTSGVYQDSVLVTPGTKHQTFAGQHAGITSLDLRVACITVLEGPICSSELFLHLTYDGYQLLFLHHFERPVAEAGYPIVAVFIFLNFLLRYLILGINEGILWATLHMKR